MDDSIDPRILQMIEELCKCAKHDIEVAVGYAKEACCYGPDLKDELENELSDLLNAKEPLAEVPIGSRL